MSLFFSDTNQKVELSYLELLQEIKGKKKIILNPFRLAIKDYLVNLLLLLYLDYNFTIYDNDLSDEEIYKLMGSNLYDTLEEDINVNEDFDLERFTNQILNSKSKFKIFSSGTSGTPKAITHDFQNFLKNIRIGEKYKNLIWGIAYNPYHIAGLNIIFQAFLNNCTLINLYKIDLVETSSNIINSRITNLSGTPTFFRLLLGNNVTYEFVNKISIGGERSDTFLIDKIKKSFPNAKIYNLYASTEAGTIFSSSGEYFYIKENLSDFVKIVEQELFIHKSLLAEFDSLENKDWYRTGDLIEFMDDENKYFKIIGRKSDLINIGGYKVNPIEVEIELNKIDGILGSKVFGQKNSVLGNILVAEVQISNEISINEKNIREVLSENLQNFKIPRKYIFIKNIEISRTVKLKR